MTFIFIAALLISATITVLLGKKFIPVLMSKKMGQPILEIGPRWHKSKEGTPTMGGLFFICASGVALCVSFFRFDSGELTRLWLSYFFCVFYGLVGIIDDSKKLSGHANQGLRAYQKILLQLLFAGLYLFAMIKTGNLETAFYIPIFGKTLRLGAAYYAFSMLFMMITANSVNLTDGLDGLASSVTAVVCAFFAVYALRLGENAGALLSIAVFGGCIGFLVYNAYPARVFMGDTGSLFLGAAVISLAYLIGSPLIIFFTGIVYFIEALSVILQVCYFHLSGGKRLFRMSPIHHHFELCGWSEKKIVFLAVAVTLVFSIISFFI